ncbi:unnamed protein product [Phyllotreta striolata]|uniref:4-nitrophenylphosphatase n=1 Tax=Phyllotreta striolata TaxID=444603 RepID=A0A9N9TKI2_PHYSR|nr:unnamed protein product [Phyllotreta striolata]
MSVIKNLAEVSANDQRLFINSFDIVLSDLDGVIWLNFEPMPRAGDCVKNLRKLNKTVHFVSNNGLASPETILTELNKECTNVAADDLVVPSATTVNYLKKLNFNKKIYAICMHPMGDQLIKNGYKVLRDPPITLEENVNAVLAHNEEDSEVGAVIMDNDVNLNYLKLQKAFWYLRKPDCLFLVTHRDKVAPFGAKGPLIGNYHFTETLKELTGKNYVEMGKPSQTCVDFIKEKFNISNPKRVLFIGDSIQSDMQIGTLGGFQKLLVLSGTDTIEEVMDWKYPQEYKPQYYIQDLKAFNEIIIKSLLN